MIAAILRAQLLSLRSIGRTRGSSSFLSAIPALFFYGFWSFLAFGAFALLRSLNSMQPAVDWLPAGLLCVFLYWQVAPVITMSMGASLDLQKLIVYPIDLDKLFIVEVMLRFLTVTEMLILLTGAGLGIALNPVFGGWVTLVRVLCAFGAFVVFNLLIGAGVRSWIERAFRQKRFREIFMLGFVLVCASPSLLVFMRVRVDRILPYLPVHVTLPWGAASAFAIGQTSLMRFGLAAGALSLWIALAYRFGRAQFYRSLRSDPYAGRQPSTPRKEGSRVFELFFRLPGRFLPDPVGAMVEKELRSLSRCVGFRLAFTMGFTFGILIFLPQILTAKSGNGFMREHFLVWVSLYSILLVGYYTFWNAFGFDRTAAQFYFAAPVRFRQVLIAKNISALIMQGVELILLTLVFAVLPLPFHAFALAEAYTVTAVVCLYLFALGNVTSIRFPVAIDPEKMGRGAASRSVNMLSMLILPVAFLPIGLAYWGRAVFKSDLVFFLLLSLAAIIGAVFYWVGTDSAVNASRDRREQMIAALTKGQGPLTTS